MLAGIIETPVVYALRPYVIEEMKAQMSGPQPQIMKEDEKNFCDPDYRMFVITEEFLMAEKTPRAVRI